MDLFELIGLGSLNQNRLHYWLVAYPA